MNPKETMADGTATKDTTADGSREKDTPPTAEANLEVLTQVKGMIEELLRKSKEQEVLNITMMSELKSLNVVTHARGRDASLF